MRKPDPLWQRIAFVVGIGLFAGVMKFIARDASDWIAFGAPAWDAALAIFLFWMQLAPVVAAGIWINERLKSGQTTQKQVDRFCRILLPAVLVPLAYDFFHSFKMSADMQAIFLAAICVWSLFALWVTGQFTAKSPAPPGAER